MRKLSFALFFLISLSLFAQESENSQPVTEGSVKGYDVNGNFISDADIAAAEAKLKEEEESKKDLSQEYLAKSAAPVNAVAWTHDGKYFATSWNNSVILWNSGYNTIAAIYSNSVLENINPEANVTSLRFTNDGRYMMCVRDDNTILIHGIEGTVDSTLISGTGDSISDAVYLGDYRIALPLDGKNLYESFKLSGSGEHIIEEKLDFSDGIWALSASPNGLFLLATSDTGVVHLIDTDSWTELSNFERYSLTKIKPKFAPDGLHFVSAQNPNTLIVASAFDESDVFTIEDRMGFSFTAEFSSDATKIAAGINSGCVKIFDIESGLEENSFQLMAGDTAKSLAFSPDDKYIVIGTEKGYIYHWVLSGEPFVPENQREQSGLRNSLLLSLGFSRLGTDYYVGNGTFEIGYRNYFKPPFYWGFNGSVGLGVPGSEFPYSYYEEGQSLSSPFLYTFTLGGSAGLVYYNKKYDLHVFSEAGFGGNVRFLFNNSTQYAHTSKPYFGVYGEMLAGLQWKWVRTWGGMQFDTNLHWIGKVHLGIAIPTGSFKRKK